MNETQRRGFFVAVFALVFYLVGASSLAASMLVLVGAALVIALVPLVKTRGRSGSSWLAAAPCDRDSWGVLAQ